jgi:hypothetical protein
MHNENGTNKTKIVPFSPYDIHLYIIYTFISIFHPSTILHISLPSIGGNMTLKIEPKPTFAICLFKEVGKLKKKD